MSLRLSLSILVCFVILSCNPEQPAESKAKNESTLDSTGTGLKVTRRKDGSLVSTVYYQDSLRHGTGKSYYPNGNLQLEITYKEGRKHSMEKYYYENGKPYRFTNYKEGEMDSTQVFYHENGKLKAKVPYRKGKLCEGTEEFKDDGKKISMPDIVVKTRDEVALTGKYLFELSVSRRLYKVEFDHIEDPENIPCPQFCTSVESKAGKFEFALGVPKGQFMMLELYFGADCLSYQRIPHYIVKRVAVSTSNRI